MLKTVFLEKKEEKDNISILKEISDKVLIEKKVEVSKKEVKVNNFMNMATRNIDKILYETDINLNDLFSEEVFRADNSVEDKRKLLDYITKVFEISFIGN